MNGKSQIERKNRGQEAREMRLTDGKLPGKQEADSSAASVK